MKATLNRQEVYAEPRDIPGVALNSDGVYLVTIIVAVLLFSVMVGVYL